MSSWKLKFIFIISAILLINIFTASIIPNSKNYATYDSTLNSQDIVQDIYTKEWLDNPTFETPIDPWYNTTSGDTTDVNASYSNGYANMEVVGDKRTFTFVEDPPQASNWTARHNPDFPAYPEWPQDGTDQYTIDEDGFWAQHQWVEGPRQSPSIQWIHNVKLPIIMEDYEITSASVRGIVNATVNSNVDVNTSLGDTPDGDNDDDPQGVVYDFVKMYIRIADPDFNEVWEIAYNKTWNLGLPSVTTMADRLMKNTSEKKLKFYLASVLSYDYQNFTIIVGMDIFCEDNCWTDRDEFTELRVKSVSLNFTYEKQVDQSTSISWNQVGNQITGANIDIENATLDFKYKIDQPNWTTSSPNSEIRVYLNDRIHTETVKLSKAKDTFQDIKVGGFDVTSLILKDVNISVSIQVYLADTFTLNQTITVSIDNASLLISYVVNTVETETKLDLFLEKQNKTLEKSIEVTMGYTVNITVKYKDIINNFIENATVQLIGLVSPIDLSEDDFLDQYNITIHTSELSLGNNYLRVIASKKYYESVDISFNVKVIERKTDLQLYLDRSNETLDKSITMIYGNSGNITVTYKDKEFFPYVHISEANVTLIGLGIPQELQDIGLEQYTIIIDTKDLGLGVTYLSVNAVKENYTSQSIRFKIEVIERNSYIDKIFLNKTESTFIIIPWNENLNIAITYNDSLTDAFIDNALVKLTGTGILHEFDENSPLNYSTDINTNKLKLGVNFLTISAQKDNYSLSTQIITISVIERETDIEIYINNSLYLPSQFYNSSVGEFLNITVFYKDSNTGLLINNATVKLIESGIPDELDEHPLSHYYSIIVEMELLGAGVKFLTITANKDNYTFASQVITLMINEKKTGIELYINGIQYFDGETIESEINDKLNVTIRYFDNITKTFLPGATVELIDKGELDENPSLEYYNITVSVFDLEKTLNRLSIRAHIENYEFALIEFFVQVIERETDGLLILNNLDKTNDPYLELPITSILNITVKYTDGRTGDHIPGATIQLAGDLTAKLNESSSLGHYYIIINTAQLSLGLNIFTIIAERANFQPYTIQKIYINIRRINTNITTVSGETTISAKPGKNVRFGVVLYDLDFGGTIKGASVTFRWQYDEGDLTDPDNDGIYEGVIRDVPVGSFVITIYAYLGDEYDFEPFEIILSVIRKEQNVLLYQGLIIGTSIAAGVLTSYIIVYQQILRFPKPVRKVRKFRKTLRRKSAPNISIVNREVAFNSIYSTELSKTSRFLRLKPPLRKEKPKKEEEQKPLPPLKYKPTTPKKELEEDDLIKKSLEKKAELDETLKKPEESK